VLCRKFAEFAIQLPHLTQFVYTTVPYKILITTICVHLYTVPNSKKVDTLLCNNIVNFCQNFIEIIFERIILLICKQQIV